MADNKLTRILQGALNMVPGYPSLNGLINKKNYGIRQALYDLQNQVVPFNGAYQDWLNDRPQDWNRNAIEAALIFAPYAKGVGKKMASSLGDVTGKGGFLNLSTDVKHTNAKSVLQDAGLTGREKKLFEEYAKGYNKMIQNPPRNMGEFQRQMTALNKIAEKAEPETREALMAFTNANAIRKQIAQYNGVTTMPKPDGFDTWTAQERINWLDNNLADYEQKMMIDEGAKVLQKSKLSDTQGPIYPDIILDSDLRKARQELAAEEAEKAAQIQMPEFVEEAYNAQPIAAQDIVNPRGPQNRYDHSRQFEDTALKEMPAVDRSGAKYYEDTDPLYDIYKIWREHPEISGDEGGSKVAMILNKELGRADRSKANNAKYSPFEAAGAINDANVRLWNSIKALRAEGKTDAQIREILVEDLNKYQGMLERYKARRDAEGSLFKYDGALTNSLIGSPSEKARASEAATVVSPNYAELDLLTKFYSDILKNRR